MKKRNSKLIHTLR